MLNPLLTGNWYLHNQCNGKYSVVHHIMPVFKLHMQFVKFLLVFRYICYNIITFISIIQAALQYFLVDCLSIMMCFFFQWINFSRDFWTISNYLSSVPQYCAVTNCALVQYPTKRFIVRSHKASKPRDLYIELSDRSDIWQTPRQHCCRCACQSD